MPEGLHAGDTVRLAVVSDVTVDGRVVIKAGAPVVADVVDAQGRNMIGIAAKIGIALRTVEAVDGTQILVSANKFAEGKDKMIMSIGLSLICCILFALMKGGDASIPAGTEIIAATATATQVEVQ